MVTVTNDQPQHYKDNLIMAFLRIIFPFNWKKKQPCDLLGTNNAQETSMNHYDPIVKIAHF